MSLTITEALAEIKTLQKRLAKKRDFVGAYLFRQDTVKDPLENQGGSKSAILAERQSIRDLEERAVKIRSAIQQANVSTMVTIGNETRSIADWLVWRREIAPTYKEFVSRMRSALVSARQQAQRQGVAVRPVDQQTGDTNDLIVNVDEKALSEESEQIEQVLGTLDGLLSLKNATTVIDL